jgi:exopolyphosphatase/guanosine-5'-triphosphate,3'-diphosphate pyrophosphatase
MRVAAIDVGTNSTRLLVAEEQLDGFRTVDRRTIITRLGEGVDRRRALSEAALRRTFDVIAEYVATCGELGVERLRVTGTSAVRDARNRERFFEGVRRLTGQAPELLSGDAEARATFLGVRADLAGSDPLLVVDIGGGSTEFISGYELPEHIVSLDFGCVRMLEKHLHSDPPTVSELQALRAEVTAQLEAVTPLLEVPPGARLVGVAGTVTQLASLKAGLAVYDAAVVHHTVLSHGEVRMLARRLASLPYEKRRRVKGLVPGRVDVIVAGAEILICVMEAFDAAEVLVSEKDILEGLVLQLLSAAKPRSASG